MQDKNRLERIILVEPADNLNIGAAARAMMNLGFTELVLVAPKNYRPKKAMVTACWASEIVSKASVCSTLAEAVVDQTRITAFSAREGKNRPVSFLLPEWGQSVVSEPLQNIALVFGPEDNGLRQEHLDLCTEIVKIPASDLNPSFNLAQAVLLALFELVRSKRAEDSIAKREFPSGREIQELNRLIEETMQLSGFSTGVTPPELPALVTSIFRRARPDSRELNILLGLFSRVTKRLQGNEQQGDRLTFILENLTER